METPPSPPQPPIEADVASAAKPNFGDCNMTLKENHTGQNSTSNVIVIKKKMKNKKKRKDVQKSHVDVSSDHPQRSLNASSSSSSSIATSNLLHPRSKGIRLSSNRRNPRVSSGPVSRRQIGSEADALALPLGMSIAAFVAQVLERKDATGEKMSADYLSQICTLAVKESLFNVFGDKFDCFVSNFERSFQSTLMTLRVISESSRNKEERPYHNGEGSSTCGSGGNDFNFDTEGNRSTCQDQTTIVGEDEEIVHRDPVSRELAVLDDSRYVQQLACIAPNQLHSGGNQSMLSTLERSVSEQTRSNDLKAFEISLIMKKMKLKEAQIAVDCDSNYLERFKLSMGISKANFRAEKFKTELEDSRHAQLLKKCVDCLVAGLLIMLACLAYGTYIHSHQRLIEATESCMPVKESSSWWIPKPMASFSSGFQILQCQVQVISRMLFGVLMIIVITFLLIKRSGTTNQTMPVTFILLLLGVGCGFAGKFCIDTLGGSGNHWLVYWEVLCLVHFFANVCTSMLFFILHGPVTVTERSVSSKLFPYWFRRFVFYAMVLVWLPLLCGLIPFAGPGEWLEHFGSLIESRVS
ncbi:protein CPR-5 [Cynara cardunculus var. scolymus]|uniref:Protein CPR-5 n=1 Tax=Cynara cardunculus var. scolymus TaxID=59895 RepID=A0A103YG98_CYNCS|nr:protein CPR-5 [Cynara cardunculus var. scolymus]KVI08528.1 hypothetical protein Ccrd_013104 [Cynara cardunculus var. scolymus]